jgi:ceramide synthetase
MASKLEPVLPVDDHQVIISNLGTPVELTRGGDFTILLVLVPVICFIRVICEKVGHQIFMDSEVAQRLKHKKKHILALQVKKFVESFWKSAYYASVSAYALVFIAPEAYMKNTFEVYPNPVTSTIYWYYMVQISFYIWMSVSLLWDVRRKDFYQMGAHHVITLTKLIISYLFQVVYMGALVLMIHDFADPFLEFAKMMNYLKKETASTVSFIVFLLAFVFLRIIIYPIYCIQPAITDSYPFVDEYGYYVQYYTVCTCLVALLGLNIFWSVLIIKVAIRAVSKTSSLRDVRSDDEGSD